MPKPISPDNHAIIISKLNAQSAIPLSTIPRTSGVAPANETAKNADDFSNLVKGAKAAYDLESRTKILSKTYKFMGNHTEDKIDSKSPGEPQSTPIPSPRVQDKSPTQSKYATMPFSYGVSPRDSNQHKKSSQESNPFEAEKPTPPPRPGSKSGSDFSKTSYGISPPQLPVKPKVNKSLFANEPTQAPSLPERKSSQSSTTPPPPPPRRR
ncbi:hypothetical protein DSO57_1013722 [Entomophthora muscae]|uniref:Uncharacterized protein n=1 Tax=Entomophthora muscae TaxID=34485 RepID=A0ACC2UEI0_9FUNG|nr:hypothetical protein DSO57_1013722 [Entomophthora muscae]